MPKPAQTGSDVQSLQQTISKEIAALRDLEALLTATPAYSCVLDLMQKTPGRIIFTGMGKSGIVAQKIVASLASTGTPAFFVHPAEASHGDLGMITAQDMVIAISNSGESKELADILNYCKRFSIPLVGVTKNVDSTLGKNADYVLPLPQTPEADPLGLAPTCSTTATLALGDVLTVALMSRKRFTKQDFQDRHPGGKLGAVLQKASDIMHTGAEMPILSQEAPFQEIIVEMSAKRLGCVGFVNKQGELTGVFTDGDLRRNMSPDLFFKVGKDFMHLNPQQAAPEELASSLLAHMQRKKITSLFITQHNKPVGIVHIHDLLQIGVI